MNTYPEMNREIVKLLRSSGENYELYAAARIEELEAQCETLSKAFDAAKGYIDSSVCDPDTTAEMWKAYEAYQSALERVKAPNA